MCTWLAETAGLVFAEITSIKPVGAPCEKGIKNLNFPKRNILFIKRPVLPWAAAVLVDVSQRARSVSDLVPQGLRL